MKWRTPVRFELWHSSGVMLAAILFGFAAWVLIVVPVPNESFTGDSGGAELTVLLIVLLVAAFVAGFVRSGRAWAVGLALVVGPLVMAPWSTPRGDNDGLWILVFPYLVVWGLVCAMVVAAGSWAARRVRRART